MQRALPASQTLEPVQVAGFSQMHDDAYGTKSRQTAGAIDQKFGQRLYLGASATGRQLSVPFIAFDTLGQPIGANTPWKEEQEAGYIRWLPTDSAALSFQIIKERFNRTPELQGTGAFLSLDQLRMPLTFQWFSASGFATSLRATYLRQDGIFCAAQAPHVTYPEWKKTTTVDWGLSYGYHDDWDSSASMS
jgi:hypothetical protein